MVGVWNFPFYGLGEELDNVNGSDVEIGEVVAEN